MFTFLKIFPRSQIFRKIQNQKFETKIQKLREKGKRLTIKNETWKNVKFCEKNCKNVEKKGKNGNRFAKKVKKMDFFVKKENFCKKSGKKKIL